MLKEVAKHLGEKIPGRRNATYTKPFERGLICMEPAPVYIPKTKKQATLDDCVKETFFVSASGSAANGVGTRVMRHFPTLMLWATKFVVFVSDDAITEELLKRYTERAGKLIGLGRFRPQNGGYYGMFRVESVKPTKVEF